MTRAPFKHQFNADKTTITIDVGQPNPQPITAEQLEIIMEWLGKYRAEMSPRVPQTPDPAMTRPRPISTWHVQALGAGSPAMFGAVIAFRSEQFGWFALTLSADDCRQFAHDLANGDALPVH